jgi:hypothetical protein
MTNTAPAEHVAQETSAPPVQNNHSAKQVDPAKQAERITTVCFHLGVSGLSIGHLRILQELGAKRSAFYAAALKQLSSNPASAEKLSLVGDQELQAAAVENEPYAHYMTPEQAAVSMIELLTICNLQAAVEPKTDHSDDR